MLYDEEEVPEARFAYNISPMSVLVRTEKRPWYDFVTKVLAIVGGTFSVVSQSVSHSASPAWRTFVLSCVARSFVCLCVWYVCMVCVCVCVCACCVFGGI